MVYVSYIHKDFILNRCALWCVVVGIHVCVRHDVHVQIKKKCVPTQVMYNRHNEMVPAQNKPTRAAGERQSGL